MSTVRGELVTCKECGRRVPAAESLLIDEEAVCRRCLHGDGAPLCMYPLGYVREGLAEDAPHGAAAEEVESRIELLPGMAQFMRGLEEERNLTVVWAPDRSPGVRTVFPRGLDGKEVGIFASRSPHRVNSLAVTEVDLVRVEGLSLFVRGLDAFSGSPVLDVKLGRR